MPKSAELASSESALEVVWGAGWWLLLPGCGLLPLPGCGLLLLPGGGLLPLLCCCRLLRAVVSGESRSSGVFRRCALSAALPLSFLRLLATVAVVSSFSFFLAGPSASCPSSLRATS